MVKTKGKAQWQCLAHMRFWDWLPALEEEEKESEEKKGEREKEKGRKEL